MGKLIKEKKIIAKNEKQKKSEAKTEIRPCLVPWMKEEYQKNKKNDEKRKE